MHTWDRIFHGLRNKDSIDFSKLIYQFPYFLSNHTEIERVLELIGELPHVGVNPSECREGDGSNPDVDESVRVGVWDARVASVRVSEIFLHFLSFALQPRVRIRPIGIAF